MKTVTIYLGILGLSATLLLEGSFSPAVAWSKDLVVSPSPYQIAQTRTYRVKLGDTLSGIAYKNGVSVSQLLSYNPSLRSNPNLISIGQVLYLSKPSNPTPKPSPVAKKPTKRPTPQTFKLPSQRRTSSNRVGARRGDPKQDCRVNLNDNLRALLPDTNLGYTLQDYPTLFWYMPALKSQPERLELKVRRVGEDSFKTHKFNTPNQTAGIMNVTLPQDLGPLEEGQEYQWEVRVYCTAGMFISATGNIQRLSTNQSELSQKLEKASVEDYPAILAEAGVWYDALSILAALRTENPSDATITEDWSNILKMIGFENIASKPLLNGDLGMKN